MLQLGNKFTISLAIFVGQAAVKNTSRRNSVIVRKTANSKLTKGEVLLKLSMLYAQKDCAIGTDSNVKKIKEHNYHAKKADGDVLSRRKVSD